MPLELPREDPCPFCEYLAGRAPCAFVRRGANVSSLLNRAQYERGALLVVPNAHIGSLLDASEALVSEVYIEAQRLSRILVDRLGATGVNVFQNNGRSAGQTVAHFHVHVVPRYPSSDPARRFREADFERTGLEELRVLAEELRA